MVANDCAALHAKDMLMYRLMKSEKFIIDPMDSGSVSHYRQIQVSTFQQLCDALASCETINEKKGPRHFVLNELGKEYHRGAWID